MNASSNPSMATIILQDKAAIDNDGKVKFENLGISMALSNLQLEYFLDQPFGINS